MSVVLGMLIIDEFYRAKGGKTVRLDPTEATHLGLAPSGIFGSTTPFQGPLISSVASASLQSQIWCKVRYGVCLVGLASRECVVLPWPPCPSMNTQGRGGGPGGAGGTWALIPCWL